VRAISYVGALALLTVFVSLPARAGFVWNESNAGSLPPTAEVTQGAGALTQINGHLDFDLNTQLWGVDMYAIGISDPSKFMAFTEDGPANLSDPALYLFNALGVGVYMNNDNSGTDFQATLPAGSPFGPSTSGLYYLAVAWGFSDALSGDSIFSLDQFLDTTGVYGATGPGGADSVAAWNTSSAPSDFNLPANYSIDLRGAAAAPEPGTLALLAAAALGMMTRRRRIS